MFEPQYAGIEKPKETVVSKIYNAFGLGLGGE